jgi:hypothetical protein
MLYRLSLIFILCLCFNGCNQQSAPVPSAESGSGSNVPAEPVDPMQKLVTQYDQLKEKRLELQNKIEQAFLLYEEYKETTKTQRETLKSHLGTVPIDDAVEIFIRNKDIPSNLIPALSCWRSLVPDVKAQEKIFDWIENKQKSNMLVDLEVKMKMAENYRKIGSFLNESDQKEVDRLLATEVGDWNESKNDLYYEQKAVERLKEELMK